MIGDAGFRFLLQVFGYLYPGYLCFKEVQNRKSDKLKLWCMYWVVMAAFSAIQPFADALLFFLPLYFPAKLAFACYLWVNNLAGTELVYTKYVEPVVTRYEPLVDRQIAEAREMVTDLVSRTFSRAVRWLQTKVTAALANAHQSAQQNGEEKSNPWRADRAGHAAPAAGFRSDSFLSAASSFGRSFSSKSE